MEYYEYWGLSAPPFSLSPDPDKLYLSKQHYECLLRLRYAIDSNKGGALLVSENAGDGKTSVLQKLIREVQTEKDGRAAVAFITHPTLTPTQMIGEIGRQLGLSRSYRSKMRTLNELRALLVSIHEEGRRALVIVDEGQMLANRPDILQELRILLNFCVADAFLLTFILSGQKGLEPTVRSMPEFWQRLPVRYFLGNLDFQDTRKLIQHRLQLAGLPEGREIFADEAYAEVFRASEGCPRVICSIADLALVIGRSMRVKKIEASEVAQARADMEKSAGGNFHYYYFLKSKDKGGAVARPAPQLRGQKHPQARVTESGKERTLEESAQIPTALAGRNALRVLLAHAERAGFRQKEGEIRGLKLDPGERFLLHIPRKRSLFGKSVRLDIFGAKAKRNLLASLAVTTKALAVLTPEGVEKVKYDEALKLYTARTEGASTTILILETGGGTVYRIYLNDIGRSEPDLVEALLRYMRAAQREPAPVGVLVGA
ncbi:MAG: AAA family ATPase [Planctomycetota bacterium]